MARVRPKRHEEVMREIEASAELVLEDLDDLDGGSPFGDDADLATDDDGDDLAPGDGRLRESSPAPRVARLPSGRPPAIEPTEGQVSRLQEQLERVEADYLGFRGRADRRTDEAVRRARDKLLARFLPVLDNLHRALQCATDDDDPLVEGTRLVVQQFDDLLAAEGVTRIESVGEPFDPERHEAVSRVESADRPAGSVVEEILPGYLVEGRLLRAAKVTVAVAPPSAPRD